MVRPIEPYCKHPRAIGSALISRRIILKIIDNSRSRPDLTPCPCHPDRQRFPSISSPRAKAEGQTLEARSPISQTPAQIVHQHKPRANSPRVHSNIRSKKSPSLRSGKRFIARLRRTLLKAAGLCPAPRSSPEGHAFKRHAWLTHCVAMRPQCFNAASPRLYTIALNYFFSIYGGNVRIIHIS